MAASLTLQEVRTFLLAAGIGLTAAAVKLGVMPDKPDVMTTLLEYPGPQDDAGFGSAGSRYEHPRMQIVVRGAPDDYQAARLQAEKIRQALAGVQGQTLSGTLYLMVKPLTSPFPMGEDVNKRPRIACNYQVDKELSPTV